jgi:SAM-dependent methyltransferase
VATSGPDRTERELHWDTVYRDRGIRGVSWYQSWPTVSVELIRRLGIPMEAAILDVGGGASALAATLIAEGFMDVAVLDISDVALRALRHCFEKDPRVTAIHADLLTWTPDRSVDLWHDRAVFHFLVEAHDRHIYLSRLRQCLRKAGHIILGVFAPDGPTHCSGLPVARYSVQALSEVLGADFEIVEHQREEHITPSGDMQPFTWIAGRFGG